MKNKKGTLDIRIMIPVLFTFFAFALVIAMSSFVLNNLKQIQTSNTTEYNATSAVGEGVETFASLMPAAGVVIGAAFIILVILYFGNTLRRR